MNGPISPNHHFRFDAETVRKVGIAVLEASTVLVPCLQCAGNGAACRCCQGRGEVLLTHFSYCPRCTDRTFSPALHVGAAVLGVQL